MMRRDPTQTSVISTQLETTLVNLNLSGVITLTGSVAETRLTHLIPNGKDQPEREREGMASGIGGSLAFLGFSLRICRPYAHLYSFQIRRDLIELITPVDTS